MQGLAAGALRGLDTLLGPLLMAKHRRDGAGLIVLYHRVTPEADPLVPAVTPAAFEEHCRFFKDSFQVIPLAEMVERLRGGRSPSGCCAITFDDGYLDFLE